MKSNESFVADFLKAIERGEVSGREQEWYTEDAIQIEWPNKIAPHGAERDLAAIREAGERGQSILERQSYQVTRVVGQGQDVAVEAIFEASFKIDLPGVPQGEMIKANFAMFFTLREGRICRHSTYDCFWS